MRVCVRVCVYMCVCVCGNGDMCDGVQVRNKKNQTPLDLCSDPTLMKLLKKCSEEHKVVKVPPTGQ